MIKSPMFSAAAETTTPPQTSSLAAPRPSPPGPASPASLWLHNHAYHRHRSAHRALRQSADAKLTVPILQRMVSESAVPRPGQHAVLSRITEVLFVEVLRSWMKSLGPAEGGWIGAIADPHIGKALQLIHEQPERPWTLRELGRRAGLGRSAFSARFTSLVGQPMRRY